MHLVWSQKIIYNSTIQQCNQNEAELLHVCKKLTVMFLVIWPEGAELFSSSAGSSVIVRAKSEDRNHFCKAYFKSLIYPHQINSLQ